MDKYEYRVKTEQMLEYMEKKLYKKAMEIADTIDWRRVKNFSMLSTVSEIYECNGENQKSRDILFIAYDRSPGSRKIVYRLGTLAVKINDLQEASDCYEEFVKLAPKDPNQFILKYKILKAQNAPIEQQIEALIDFKKVEYVEKWAYELAKLYHEAGMITECLEECDDLILWFNEGKYVLQAMRLKMQHKPLTPLQQEKYSHCVEGQTKSQFKRPAKQGRAKEETEEKAVEKPAKKLENTAQPEEDLGATRTFDVPKGFTKRQQTRVKAPKEARENISRPIVTEQEASEEALPREESGERIIKKTVVGATLAEALARGVAEAAGKEMPESQEESPAAAMPKEEPRTAQDKIEGILQGWEEKQKAVEREIKEKRRRAEAKKTEREAKKKAEKNMFNTVPIIPDDIQKLLEDLENGILDDDSVAEATEPRAEAAAEIEVGTEIQTETQITEEVQEDFGEVNLEEESLEEENSEEESLEKEKFQEENLEVKDSEEESLEEEKFEEESFEEEDFGEEDLEEEGFEEEDLEEEDFEEDDLEEESFEEDFEEEDFEEEDFEEDFEEDEDIISEKFDIPTQDEEEILEEPEEDEEPEKEKSALERLEEEIVAETQKSPGGVPFDTGFVVQGRYDLEVQSEIGLKAGLTEEQKKLFSYFVPVRGMSEQIVEVLDNDKNCKTRYGTSRTGNILVVGRPGTGKTVLAVNIVKAIQKDRKLKQGKVAIVTGEALNKKELTGIIGKLKGGALIIEKAGKMNSRTVRELNEILEEQTGELLVVLEEQRKPLEKLLSANPEFKRKFTSKIELPIFINDELVTFGQTYAKENGYKIDEMGILALYSRIDIMQKEDHAVTVAEVKDIIDEAIENAQKANVKHLMKRVFGKHTDSSDRVILTEQDFK